MRAFMTMMAGVFACAMPAVAQTGALDEQLGPDIEKRLRFQSGHIALGDLATVDLPDGYRFLSTDDARFVLETLWGNQPDPDILGMIVPPGQQMPDSWVVVLSFEPDGYVKDDDARGMDFNDLLKQMQKSARDSAPEIRKRGYPAAQLLGWAEPPHYDPAAHKLYWAKRLQFDNDPSVTLNYDVRILGRRGVLVLTAVADESDLSVVAPACQTVLAGTNFTSGNQYQDFDASIDKIAAYGIGGLIAGKLLVKAGILKVLLKPLIIVGAVISAAVGKLFVRRKTA